MSTTIYLAPDRELRDRLAAEWSGQPGPIAGRDEHAVYQQLDTGEWVVSLSSTRPATFVDVLRGERPITRIKLQADYVTVELPDSEYRAGGIVGALRRHSGMSDEDRAAAGERLRAARSGAALPSALTTQDEV